MKYEEAMAKAIELARAAASASGDLPVGAIIVNSDGEVIATGANQRELSHNPVAHAEIIAIDEEFFILVRVLGSHISLFISDVTCALDYEVASEFLEIADLPTPEDDDEPLPGGHMDIINDLGMGHMELEALCDDTELFPDEQLEAIAKRLGFADEFVELLEL